MTKADDIARVIRRRLKATVKVFREERVAVALSGGVDSCSILAEMLDQGMRPLIVSYAPSTTTSTDFTMAKSLSETLRLEFRPAIVDMSAVSLERDVRTVIGLGYRTKVAVECLTPLVTIHAVAARAGASVIFTGDQADGFFVNNKWSAHNLDRSRKIPRGQRTNVQQDMDSERIDYLRMRYWKLDRSCSGGVRKLGERVGLRVVVPYRDKVILEAVLGSTWKEVNRPRFKEPIRLAYGHRLGGDIPVRKMPVNLHKGDSYFAATLGRVLLEHMSGPWKTTTGLYSAIWRGEI